MNPVYKDLEVKLEKTCQKNKVMNFRVGTSLQGLRKYHNSEKLGTVGGKTVHEPYILCKIPIRYYITETIFNLSVLHFQYIMITKPRKENIIM